MTEDPEIVFRAKIEDVFDCETNKVTFRRIKVPVLKRSHCDMQAFRMSRAFGSYANSDLFPSILGRVRSSIAKDGYLRLDWLPENVSVDTSGFLAKVTIRARPLKGTGL